MLVRICGWCPDHKVKTDEAVVAGNKPSHTICPSCYAKMMAELDAEAK